MSASNDVLARLRLTRMAARRPDESHRVASSLELFFDLVFVIGVSATAVQLHHAMGAGEWAHGIVSYAMVFFAIWWAWMNFTWFGTSFSTDDWLYRVVTIVQMGGVLVLAAGVAPAFQQRDFTIIVIAYVVMRVAMIAQWLRAAASARALRRTATTYAVGIAVVQVLWVGFLFVPSAVQLPMFLVGVLAEIAVPVIAERGARTPWHPEHITERYSLFTLIVLGESLLASANAIIGALDRVASLGPLISIAVLALVSTAAVWWIYFWPPHHRAISSLGRSLRYGYVHYVVFAAAGAFSAGIGVEIDRLTGESSLSATAAAFAVSVPIALFLLGIWVVAIRGAADRIVNTVIPIGAALVLVDPVLPLPVALTALILVGVVVVLVCRPPLEEVEAGED